MEKKGRDLDAKGVPLTYWPSLRYLEIATNERQNAMAKPIDRVIADIASGVSTTRAYAAQGLSRRSIGCYVRRDPKLGAAYMMAKSNVAASIVDAVTDAIYRDDVPAMKAAMHRAKKLEPRKDWVAIAEASVKAKRTSQRARDDRSLATIATKLERQRLKDLKRASLPRHPSAGPPMT
jgi:hypothetical protein